MSADLLALVGGTLLAVGALSFVLAPLFLGARPRARKPVAARPAADDSAVRALREIEFDKATGKLSDADYAELKRSYSALAVQQLRDSTSGSAAAPTGDPIEDRVRAYRATHRGCKDCGLRPEFDAIYCSNCGLYLSAKCPDCGSAITESAAGFCSTCGTQLAA